MASKANLNEEQAATFKALQKFIKRPGGDTFVLKGYAGTGKTFLMQHLAEWLKDHNYDFSFLASTGRAATVLKGKTGYETRTVHSELYQFSKVNGDHDDIPDDAPAERFGQMVLEFGLRKPDQTKRIYIVDESSMLSSEESATSDRVSFGSGRLLIDFFNAVGSNKVIFVGDPGQLPPVGQLFSPALDMNWLAQQGRTAIFTTLTKIERQDSGNGILELASRIRKMEQESSVSRYVKLPASDVHNVQIHPSQADLYKQYLEKFRAVGSNCALAVARTNKMVSTINCAMRRDLFGDSNLPLQTGEILMVVQNNYAVPLTNGDFVEIVNLGQTELKANLLFQSVRVKSLASDEEFDCLLSLDILKSNDGNLTAEQSRELMIDFSKRMRKRKIRANSDLYKELMMKDRYLNCLKAKFGYAVTCHKAQGGEWDDVFLFLEKSMYSMEHAELIRWWYTAVTRAKQQLHLHQEWWIT